MVARKQLPPDSPSRERVLNVAARLFAERGYGLTSMRDIARAARIRAATLYHHVRSKADLYHEVLDREQARLRELMSSVLAEEAVFSRQIERMVTLALDYHRENPSLAKLGLRALLGDGLTRPYDSRWLGMMEALLEPRAAKGEIKEIDPALFLITAGAIIQHHVIANGTVRNLVGRNLSAKEVAARTRRHVTQVILRSLGLDEKSSSAVSPARDARSSGASRRERPTPHSPLRHASHPPSRIGRASRK